MAEKIIVLDDDDDDEEEGPQPSQSASTSSTQRDVKSVSHLKAQQPVPTHITKSPFASAKKDIHVIQAENQKLFNEVSLHKQWGKYLFDPQLHLLVRVLMKKLADSNCFD